MAGGACLTSVRPSALRPASCLHHTVLNTTLCHCPAACVVLSLCQVWSMERLQQLRLVNAFDGAEAVVQGPGGAADRRRQLCAQLGLGRCSGAQLLTALNRFFDEATVDAALAQLGTA